MHPRDRILTWKTVTEGSKIVLPAYPLLFILVGIPFLFQNPSRTNGGAFEVSKMIMPIQWWGALFLLIGLLEAVALLSHHRVALIRLLIVGATINAFWSSLVISSASMSDLVSWSAGVWVSFCAVAHVASIRSLARDTILPLEGDIRVPVP